DQLLALRGFEENELRAAAGGMARDLLEAEDITIKLDGFFEIVNAEASVQELGDHGMDSRGVNSWMEKSGGVHVAGQLDGPEDAGGLVDGFLVFGGWHGIGNDARAGLHVRAAVLQDHRAQGDAGIQLAVETEIAHRAGVKTAL